MRLPSHSANLMSMAASCRKMARYASGCSRVDPGAGGKITLDNADDQLATA
jgi:hypothetical protein